MSDDATRDEAEGTEDSSEQAPAKQDAKKTRMGHVHEDVDGAPTPGPSRAASSATPRRKAKGKTLAGGTSVSGRGQYWKKPEGDDDDEVVDEVTAEELVDEPPKPPPPKRKSVPAPPKRRRPPPKRSAPPRKSPPKPPTRPRSSPPAAPVPGDAAAPPSKTPPSPPVKPPVDESTVEIPVEESAPPKPEAPEADTPKAAPKAEAPAKPPSPPMKSTPPPAPVAETPSPKPPPAASPAPPPVRQAPTAASPAPPPPAPTMDRDPLPEVCRAELSLAAKDPARSARLHVELAQAAEEPSAALKHYRLALEKTPDYLPAIRGARTIELRNGNARKVAQLYDAEIGIAADPRSKAMLLFAKGCAWLDLEGDRDAARGCFSEAAEAAPDDVTVLKAVQHEEQLAKEWQKVASALAQEADAAGDDKRHRAAVLTAYARLLERRLRKPEEATEHLTLALELDAQSALATLELKRLLFDAKRWRDLIALFEREAKLTTSDELRSQAWWNIARVQDDQLQKRHEAIVALENAVRLAPDDAGLLEELTRLYESQGDVDGTASSLERLAQAVQRPNEKVAVCQRLAELHDRLGGDARVAVKWYEAALALDAAFAPALHALDRLYGDVGNHEAQANMYVAEGQAPGPSVKRAAAFARAASIYDTELKRADVATTHYARALALDPNHEAAFKALVRLYRAAQAYHELLELYDRAVDRATSEDVAVAYLFKMGSIHEDVLRDAKSATGIYQRILERQAGHLGAIHALQRAAEQSTQWAVLVEALDTEAKLTKDPHRTVRLQHRAAVVVAEQLGDLDAALPRLKGLLERAPKDVEGLRTLARVYRGLARWADLLHVNEQELGVMEDRVAKTALLLNMADLAERELKDPGQSIKWYRKVLELDPQHSLANAALTRLLRSTGDYKGLARVLAAELKTQDDPARFARTAVLLGEVHEVHLDDANEAVEAYRRALDAMAGYRPAVDALVRIHGKRGEFNELANVVALASADIPDTRLSLEAELMAATIRAERLNRGDEASEVIQGIVERDPENLAALRVLERLHVASDDRAALARVLGRQADVLQHGPARVAALVHRGRILERAEETQAEDLRHVCTTILALDPANDWALGALLRLAEASGDSTLAADVHNRFTKATRDENIVAHHYTALGTALAEANPGAALHAFERAIESAPTSLAAIRGVAAMGAKLGDAAKMVRAYRLEAEWRQDPKAAADLYVQSSGVLGRLGETEEATVDAEKALTTHPDHEAAAQQLAHLLLTANNVDRLVEQLSQAAHSASDLSRKIALWRQVGELHADRRSDLGAAVAAVTRAIEAKPNDKGTILQLADLHRRDAQHVEAADLLARAVSLDDNDLDAHLQLAELYAEHINEPKKAHRHLARVLKNREDDRTALRLKLKLELDAGDRAAARKTSERLLEAAGDDDAMRAWALVEIGRTELAAGEHKKAAEAFNGAVALVGLEGDAAAEYGKLLGDKEPWERFAAALKSYLKRGAKLRIEPQTLATAYLELARVQHKLLDKAVDAFRTIESAITRCGAMPELELRHAELLAETNQAAEALTAFRGLTDKHPGHPAVWRGLIRVLQLQGSDAEASIAASALVMFDEASEAESALASSRNLRPGAARPSSFAAASIRAISAGANEDEEAVASLFGTLADALGKTFPIPFDMYGVRKSDRIKARTAHPVRQEVDALCVIFGIEEVDLYVHAGMGGDVTVEVGAPPAIMVPASVAELPEAPRIFMLARPLAAIAAGIHPVLKLGPADTALVLAAAVRRLVPNYEDGEHDMERLAVVQDRLSPSWFGRGKFDEAVQRYYAQPAAATSWAATVPLTATRAAGILCGDLTGVVAAMRAAGTLDEAKGAALLANNPVLADLVRYWMNDKARELRQLAGII